MRVFFSSPATIRSMAWVKSSIVTASAPRRVASSVASLTRLARSAPGKAGGGAGGGAGDHALARIEAVQFGEQLVERLLLLVVAAERREPAGAAERIQLVDENDA